jgi:phytanoyl-CoA dioxygenase PhyH
MGEMQFSEHGAEPFRHALGDRELGFLRQHIDGLLRGRPGVRIAEDETLGTVLARGRSMGRIAEAILGSGAKPVRALAFDKTPDANWAVGWHQDRTIVVRHRRDVSGFGPWTIKDGLVQVEPPFAVTAAMVTLRAHLDDCGAENAPLLVAPGSHRLGRIPVERIADTVAELGQRACLAAAGDVWLYSTTVLHASEASALPARRRVLHVDYAVGDLEGGLEWREVIRS